MTGGHIWAWEGGMRGLGDKGKGNRPSFYTKMGNSNRITPLHTWTPIVQMRKVRPTHGNFLARGLGSQSFSSIPPWGGGRAFLTKTTKDRTEEGLWKQRTLWSLEGGCGG